jgi:glucose dehydrogenase
MKHHSRCGQWIACIVIAGLLALAPVAQANQQLQRMSQDANQWVMPGANYSLARNSKLGQINTHNVRNLRVAWTMSTGTLRGHEGQPLVVGDMMYLESAYPNYIFAVDLNDVGHMVWKFEPPRNPNAPPVACCDVVNRGVSYADGKIIASVLDGHIYALDAKSGKVLYYRSIRR